MRSRTATVAAFTICALVAVAVVCAVSIQRSYDSTLATERSKLAATAQVFAELMAQQMSNVEDLEHTVLQQSDIIAAVGLGNLTQIHASALQIDLNRLQASRPEFQFAAVANNQGTTLATSPSDPSLLGRNFAFRDWYQGVTRTDRSYVSTAYVSAIKGAPLVVAVATPIHLSASGGSPLTGILFIGFKIGSVQAFADRLTTLQGIDLAVTDQVGTIIAREGGISGRLVSAASAPQVAGALAGGSIQTTSATDIAAGVPVPRLGWTVTASTPLSAAVAATERTRSLLLTGGLLLLLGIAGAALVLTVRRLERADSRRAASEAELRTVQHTIPDAIQVFGRDGTLLYRNPAAELFYELGPEERTTDIIATRWELLREDATVMPIADGPLATAMKTGQAAERVVVGIRKGPGKPVRWLSISTVPIRRPDAEPTGYVSLARDITEQTQTIRELQVLSIASEQLSSSLVRGQVLRALTTAAAEMCSGAGEEPRRAQLFVIDGPMIDTTGTHDPAGPVMTEGVQLPIAEHPYIQKVIATRHAVVASLNYADFGPAVAERMRLSEIRTCAWIPLTRDDRVYAVLAVAGRQHALIRSAQLERLKTLAAIGELALSNAEAHELMANMARTDPLTGVGNRRALEDQFRRMPRSRFALVAIDVDGLKKVNDAHGHDAGDVLLSRLAAALAAELRPSDLLARTGGDEFMAVLVDCDASGAIELGGRLQRAAANVKFPWGGGSISIGSAAGVAGDRPEAVAKAADSVLYEAKHAIGAGR